MVVGSTVESSSYGNWLHSKVTEGLVQNSAYLYLIVSHCISLYLIVQEVTSDMFIVSHCISLYLIVQEGEFVWPREIQGLILGSFFWGYLVTQVPGGWLSARLGGKRVFGYFMCACAVVTLLMPVAARADYRLLLFLRFAAGVCQVRPPYLCVCVCVLCPLFPSHSLA